MKSRDSLECRNCHSKNAMDPHKQKEASQIMFQEVDKEPHLHRLPQGHRAQLPKDEDDTDEPDKNEAQKKG